MRWLGELQVNACLQTMLLLQLREQPLAHRARHGLIHQGTASAVVTAAHLSPHEVACCGVRARAQCGPVPDGGVSRKESKAVRERVPPRPGRPPFWGSLQDQLRCMRQEPGVSLSLSLSIYIYIYI